MIGCESHTHKRQTLCANCLEMSLFKYFGLHQWMSTLSALDSKVVLHEVIKFTKRNKTPMFMLKLDFEKAYDMVELDCIMEALHWWSSPTWLSWITLWLRSVKITFLVNDAQRREISRSAKVIILVNDTQGREISRFAKVTVLVNDTQGREISCKSGLRQGDPLFPFIFVLTAEGLHHMITRCRAEGLLKGLGAAMTRVRLSIHSTRMTPSFTGKKAFRKRWF